MSTYQTLVPSGTVPGYPIGTYSLVGAATVHGALSDASDASYIESTDTTAVQIGVLFPTPTLPSNGSWVVSVHLHLRVSSNTAGLAQTVPWWWWRLEANDNGFLGTGINVQHHERVAGPEGTEKLDGTTAIQTKETSLVSWFSDGEHVRNMRFSDARWIILHWPGNIGGAVFRIYRAELWVLYNSWPVPTVTGPADPINSSKPTVTWTYADADNDNQTRARVVIVRPGTPSDTWPYGLPGQFGYQADGARIKAWDSGDLYTAGTSVDVSVGLTNGQQYYAYVRVWANPTAGTEQKSYWFYKIFTVTATGPALPTFTVTPDTANSRNLLNIQESSTASPHPAYYEVERLDPGETDYTPVRNGTQTATYVGTRTTGTGVGWSTPDAAGYVFGNGIIIKWRGKLTDYTPVSNQTLISKSRITGNQREWLFRNRTDGKLEFQWSTAGTSFNMTATSTVAPGTTDNTEIWYEMIAITSTNPWNVFFYKSTDGINFTQVGTTVSGAGPQLIFGSTAPIDLGGLEAFTSEQPLGVAMEALVYDQGLANMVAHPAIKGQPPLTTSFIAETGETWTFTSGANGYNQAELQVYDYEAPIGVAVTYEARAWRADTDVVPTGWVTAAGGPWTLPATQWLLKDPLDPTNNMIIKIVDLTFSPQKPMTVAVPIGTSKGVVTHTGIKGAVIDCTVRILSMAEHMAFSDLITSGRTLLLQSVIGHQWYVQPGEQMPYEILKAAPNVSGGETFPIRHAHMTRMRFYEVETP